MNIYDVSKHAGVSIATVSRVLNGNPNVSEKTRNKVLNVMAELGYTPNVFARGLGLNTMQTIGIMCSDSSDPYLANAIYYLEQRPSEALSTTRSSAAPATTWTPSRSILTCCAPNGWTRSSWPVPSSWRCGPRTTPI